MKVSDSEEEGSALGWGGLREAPWRGWHLSWAWKLRAICTGHPFVGYGSLRWNISLSPASARPHSAAEHINLVWITVLSDSGAPSPPHPEQGSVLPLLGPPSHSHPLLHCLHFQFPSAHRSPEELGLLIPSTLITPALPFKLKKKKV